MRQAEFAKPVVLRFPRFQKVWGTNHNAYKHERDREQDGSA